MTTQTKEEASLIRASRFYLTEHLTLDLLRGCENNLDSFLTDHAWEPFEQWSANSLYSEISILADSFRELML